MPTDPRRLQPSNLFPDRRTNSDRRRALNEPLVVAGIAAVGGVVLAVAGFGAAAGVVVALGSALAVAHGLHTRRTQQFHREAGLWAKMLSDIPLIRDKAPLPNAIDYLRPWAVLTDQAMILLREIEEHAPATIVDLGSGISTVLMASLCEQLRVGHVFSVDHDATYADATTQEIAWMGFQEYATVIHAPLEPLDPAAHRGIPEHGTPWFALSMLAKLPDSIDLLFVDGPPEGTGAFARYPALPILASRIPIGGRVILDDARRPDEQRAAIRWAMLEWGFELDWLPTYAGTARLIRRDIPAGSPGSSVGGGD